MAKEFVWIRLGDGAEYEKFSSPHDAGEAVGNRLGMEEWEPMSYYFISAGVEIQPNFVGKNYVSLFWGDKDAKWIKDLSQLEKNAFMDGIREGAGQRDKTEVHSGGTHMAEKMIPPIIHVEFDKPTSGYWDYGLRKGGDFTLESIAGQQVSPNQPQEHPGTDQTLRWGSFSLNFWFNCGSGRSWKEAASIAQRRIVNVLSVPAAVSVVWPESEPKGGHVIS